MTGDLSDADRAMLEFELSWWRQPGAKDAAIRTWFDLTPARYYQRLSRLIDEPAALAEQPVLVARLRRVREQGAARRRLAG